MKVLVLSIEPGSCDVDFPRRMARWMGLRLVDLRRFEENLSARLDGKAVRSETLLPVRRRDSRLSAQQWTMSAAQLLTRYAEDILQSIADGPVVIASWSAPMIASLIESAARVRLFAPRHVRIDQIKNRYAYAQAQTAQLELESAERAIARSVQHLTGANWRDDRYFNLALNTANCGDDACLRILASMIHTPVSRQPANRGIDIETLLKTLAVSDGT